MERTLAVVSVINIFRVQERKKRVCTTVAIAIVTETCGSFSEGSSFRLHRYLNFA